MRSRWSCLKPKMTSKWLLKHVGGHGEPERRAFHALELHREVLPSLFHAHGATRGGQKSPGGTSVSSLRAFPIFS